MTIAMPHVPFVHAEWSRPLEQLDPESQLFGRIYDYRVKSNGLGPFSFFMVTPDGERLSVHSGSEFSGAVEEGIAAWRALPADKRKPREIQVEELQDGLKEWWYGKAPPGTLVVRCFQRLMVQGERPDLPRKFAARDVAQDLWSESYAKVLACVIHAAAVPPRE